MSSWKRIASWKHNTEDMAADTAGRRATVSSSCRPDYRSPTDCRWYCQRRVDPPSRRRRGRAERRYRRHRPAAGPATACRKSVRHRVCASPQHDHPLGFDVHLSPPAQTTRCRRHADAPPRQNRRSKDLHPCSDPTWPGTRLQLLSRAHGVGLPLTGFTGSSYPSGQCLHDVHLAVSIDGVTEVGTVPNRLGIDEISPCADATRPVRRVRSPGPCCCWRKPRPTPLVPSSLRPTVGGNRCGVACWR